MNLDDLNNLDINNMGVWPTPAKVLVLIVLAILVGVGWYYFDTKEQLVNLKAVEQQELALRDRVREQAVQGGQSRGV